MHRFVVRLVLGLRERVALEDGVDGAVYVRVDVDAVVVSHLELGGVFGVLLRGEGRRGLTLKVVEQGEV